MINMIQNAKEQAAALAMGAYQAAVARRHAAGGGSQVRPGGDPQGQRQR